MTTATLSLPTTREYVLTPEEYRATVEKIGAVNARAIKRGFTGRYDFTGETFEHVEKSALTGLPVTTVLYRATLTGEAPSYGGARFLARVEWNEGLPILACAPGIEVSGGIDRSVLVDGKCAHCNVDRYRRHTYIIESSEGNQVQIGSTCIKDYLGWTTMPVFMSDSDARTEIDSFLGAYGDRHDSYTPETIVTTAYAAIRLHGFKPAQSYDGMPTATLVKYALGYYPIPRHHGCNRNACLACDLQRDLSAMAPMAIEATETAARVLSYVLSSDFSGPSEYVANLKTIASATMVEGKFIGLLASAPQAYARHLDQTLIRKAREAMPSTHVGAVGDKITITVKITNIRYIEGQYGTTVLYTMLDEATGNVYKWFASREAMGADTDIKVTIVGTVKKHETYNGLASTVLTRCKKIGA